MKRKLSTSILALLISLLVSLVSMIGYSAVVTNGWSVKETHYEVTLQELSDMMKENMERNGKDIDVLFTTDEVSKFSFSTYIPKNATKDNPAPVIIGAHGYNNSKEQQFPNITELTKRGYVVVVCDLAGHGRSDIGIADLTQGTEGVLAAVNYAMTMDCVDNNKIGLTGHSAGDLDAINTINVVNVDGAKARVAAFFCSAGTISGLFAGGAKDLILGVASGRYDELDTFYFNTSDFCNNFLAQTMVRRVYPTLAGPVEEGKWYTANGPVDIPGNGQALGVKDAVVIYNPYFTHVGGTYSLEASKLTVEFFYTAFGTPNGCKYIKGTSQTWPIAATFQLLGLLSYFSLAILVGAALLKTKLFSKTFAVEELNGVVVDKKVNRAYSSELPSIKSWKEIVPLVVTFVPLFILPFLAYFDCFADAANLMDQTIYNAPNTNGIAWFTCVVGLASFAMLLVNWGVRKLCHLKDGVEVGNPFAPAQLSGFAQIGKIALFAVAVVALMYVPQWVAYEVFHMNFSISVYTVGLPRFEWLPVIIFRYLPFWLVFMVANAILNAGCRYKEIPEWASTLFIACANVLPIVIMIIINHTTLKTTGQTYYTFGDPSIMIWNLIAPNIFVALVGRYYYKKTGNIWAGALIGALVLTLMALTITRHATGGMFFF